MIHTKHIGPMGKVTPVFTYVGGNFDNSDPLYWKALGRPRNSSTGIEINTFPESYVLPTYTLESGTADYGEFRHDLDGSLQIWVHNASMLIKGETYSITTRGGDINAQYSQLWLGTVGELSDMQNHQFASSGAPNFIPTLGDGETPVTIPAFAPTATGRLVIVSQYSHAYDPEPGVSWTTFDEITITQN